jgi:hypothetical protein
VPLISQADLAAFEASQARDKGRLAELSREVSVLGEREYRAYLINRVAEQTPRYLMAAWDYVHPPAGEERPALAEFAKARELDAAVLARWVVYFEEKQLHAAMKTLRDAQDKTVAEQQLRELAEKLMAHRRALETRNVEAKSLAESMSLRFRADDRRIIVSDAGQVTLWPNRGRGPESAKPIANVAAPLLAKTQVSGQKRAVLRFSGKELLQMPGMVPPVGSLFIVFRPDPAGAPGQRLIGWEDASVGQHGAGLMTDAAGAVHAILRRNGASGDVVVPAPTPVSQPEFQVLCVTWGPEGVTVRRNGQAVGSSKGIDSVSSDPAITSLQIGGPGSGSSPRFQGDVAELRVYGLPLDDQARSRVEAELTNHWCGSPDQQKSMDPIEDLYEELVSAQSPFRLEGAERVKALPADFRKRLAALQGELEMLKKKPPPNIPRAVVVQEGGPPGTPHEGFHDAAVYLRGNHTKPGKIVPRGFPKIIAGVNPPVIREGSGRRELSEWLVRSENPLTARVMANRIWQHHFGVGLVPTSANFGAMGERPSHPELLDFLAARLVSSGWSVKDMHRLIMLSSAYQQSSESNAAGLAADPENRLLWRANRRRLEAEAIRDSLLTVAGRLDSTLSGPGFQEDAIPRRSLYQMAVRTGAKMADFGPLFDAPDCSGIVERRTESVVAPQALFLMNSPLVTDMAKALAERVYSDVSGGADRQRIERLYQITLGRLPTKAEVEIGLRLVAEQQPSAWTGYCHLILCTNEFVFVD